METYTPLQLKYMETHPFGIAVLRDKGGIEFVEGWGDLLTPIRYASHEDAEGDLKDISEGKLGDTYVACWVVRLTNRVKLPSHDELVESGFR